MERGAKTLILGIALGAVGVVLAMRLKQIRDEDDPERLMSRLSEQLETLENQLDELRREGR